MGSDGTVADSIVNGPAYKAGVAPGMKLIGVNRRLYTPALLADAVVSSPDVKTPIELLVANDDYLRTVLVDYHGGPMAPRLERDRSKSDYLDEFLRPLAR
jgi:predicted metalloprotease with PDZ domain